MTDGGGQEDFSNEGLKQRLYHLRNHENNGEYLFLFKKRDKAKFEMLWQLLKIEGLNEKGLNYTAGFLNYIDARIAKYEKDKSSYAEQETEDDAYVPEITTDP